MRPSQGSDRPIGRGGRKGRGRLMAPYHPPLPLCDPSFDPPNAEGDKFWGGCKFRSWRMKYGRVKQILEVSDSRGWRSWGRGYKESWDVCHVALLFLRERTLSPHPPQPLRRVEGFVPRGAFQIDCDLHVYILYAGIIFFFVICLSSFSGSYHFHSVCF